MEKKANRLTINIIKVEDLPRGGITGPPGKRILQILFYIFILEMFRTSSYA